MSSQKFSIASVNIFTRHFHFRFLKRLVKNRSIKDLTCLCEAFGAVVMKSNFDFFYYAPLTWWSKPFININLGGKILQHWPINPPTFTIPSAGTDIAWLMVHLNVQSKAMSTDRYSSMGINLEPALIWRQIAPRKCPLKCWLPSRDAMSHTHQDFFPLIYRQVTFSLV